MYDGRIVANWSVYFFKTSSFILFEYPVALSQQNENSSINTVSVDLPYTFYVWSGYLLNTSWYSLGFSVV